MISKKNVMLQIPVRKSVAIKWHQLVKAINVSQGDLFTLMFADFLENLKKRGDENAKKSEKDTNA